MVTQKRGLCIVENSFETKREIIRKFVLVIRLSINCGEYFGFVLPSTNMASMKNNDNTPAPLNFTYLSLLAVISQFNVLI